MQQKLYFLKSEKRNWNNIFYFNRNDKETNNIMF